MNFFSPKGTLHFGERLVKIKWRVPHLCWGPASILGPPGKSPSFRCLAKGRPAGVTWGPRAGRGLSAAAPCRKTSSMLEVDDEGGRAFLRVLIHLTMHDYAPLVSGALQLLFKHFSQRQEAMHTFKQVLPPPSRGWGEGPGAPVGGCAAAH